MYYVIGVISLFQDKKGTHCFNNHPCKFFNVNISRFSNLKKFSFSELLVTEYAII
jgi:hypothetical protein